MGYGMWHNKAMDIETPIYARAFVIEDTHTGKRIAFVNAEICFISIAIKQEVVAQLQAYCPDLKYSEENVFLTAQHTHSAPGGYSHYALYNMSIPGFVPEVFEKYVSGMTEAIVEATLHAKPALVYLSKKQFDPNPEIAINRSIKAWNQNPEVPHLNENEKHLGVDWEMILLQFTDVSGKPIASINWFGVHTTSVHNDNNKICSDNKGYAASFLEEYFKQQNQDYVAAFAQKACGDISPNFIWDHKKKWTRGKYENDFDSASYNGKLQYDMALELALSQKQTPLSGPIDYVHAYVDFSDIHVAREFAHGNLQARTYLSCHGVAFLAGTTEGPGMPAFLQKAARYLSLKIKSKELKRLHHLPPHEQEKIIRKYEAHGNKDIVIESGERKILGTHNIKSLPLLDLLDPSIAIFKKLHRNGSLNTHPWTPQILPLHLAQIGEVALVGIPGEITTVASWRLRDMLRSELAFKGINEIIICSYANGYCGYFTTFEEYQVQCYEGGHTVFGEHQLGALLTKYRQLAYEFLKPETDRQIDNSLRPPVFPEEELKLRSFNALLPEMGGGK